MLEGLPPYQPPIEQGLRCLCLRYYIVATERADSQARESAKERARELCAVFIDARERPFVMCACGQALDFTAEGSVMVM